MSVPFVYFVFFVVLLFLPLCCVPGIEILIWLRPPAAPRPLYCKRSEFCRGEKIFFKPRISADGLGWAHGLRQRHPRVSALSAVSFRVIRVLRGSRFRQESRENEEGPQEAQESTRKESQSDSSAFVRWQRAAASFLWLVSQWPSHNQRMTNFLPQGAHTVCGLRR